MPAGPRVILVPAASGGSRLRCAAISFAVNTQPNCRRTNGVDGMSKGIARRRGAKAARRKKLLAERRKVAQAEANMPLAERARRLSRLPIRACLVQEGMFETGLGTV